MEVDVVEEPSTSQADNRKVLYFEEDAANFWVSNDEDGQKIKNLVTKFIELWNHRLNGKFKQGSLMYVKTIMAVHGVPFTETTERHLRNVRTDFNFKYIPSCSILDFFSDISNFECKLRRAIHTHEKIKFAYSHFSNSAQVHENSIISKLAQFTRRLDYRSVAHHLGYFYALRFHRDMEDIGMFYSFKMSYNSKVEYAYYVQLILQILISTKTNPRTNMKVFLRRLAVNVLAFVNYCVNISIIPLLCEIVCAALQYGYTEIATELVMNESKLKVTQKHDEDTSTFAINKMIIFYQQFKRGDLANAVKIKVVDEIMSMYITLADPPFILFDLCMRLQSDLNYREDEKYEIISQMVSNQPYFLKRVINLLREIGQPQDIPIAMDVIGNISDAKIHESCDIYLDLCQDRIDKPSNFGVIEEVLTQCVDRLFRFLDYASNRKNEVAWKQLWKVIQKVPPESVQAMWMIRKSWWPKFHSCHWESEASKYRAEVLTALSTELH